MNYPTVNDHKLDGGQYRRDIPKIRRRAFGCSAPKNPLVARCVGRTDARKQTCEIEGERERDLY